ncbi:MAG: hypothetical protein OXC98_08060 [bacterium]|nr:hypothetical protein [Acidimicrobiia bacterium]MCY4650309.1 hypothetical protein [bacterium]
MSRFNNSVPPRRFLLALCALSLVAAACGEDSPPETTEAAPQTTTAAVQTTTSTAAVAQTPTTTAAPPETISTTVAELAPQFEPTRLSYRYPAEGEIEYSLSIEQEAAITLEGGPAEEMPPGPIKMDTTLEGSTTYQISPGPDENTTTIRITTDIAMIDNEMSMGGISIPAPPDAQAPGFEAPIDITVVVDQEGNVLEFTSEALDSLGLGGSFLPTVTVGSQELSRPFGPSFPDHPVDIGDTWTERIEQEGPAGTGVIVTTAEHRLVEVETEAGRTILVIESEYRGEGFEWDMGELMQGMFGAFAGELSEEDAPEGEPDIPEFGLLVSATPSTTVAVIRFDPQTGLVMAGEYQASGEVTTDMTVPDETGEPAGILSSISYDQTVTYQLISPAS